MPLTSNKVVCACAGSGKTTYVVEEALKITDNRVLIITYTLENLDQIKKYIIARCGHVPAHIEIKSWFAWLLQDGVRPYQNYKLDGERIKSVYYFYEPRDKALIASLRYRREEDPRHYLTSGRNLYEDKVSQFVAKCNEQSGELIIKRLQTIYGHILIDEAQDLEGWDYDVIGGLFQSSIPITLVGDPRQKILKTHRSNKNRKFPTVFEWLAQFGKENYEVEDIVRSHRCNQRICDFADKLYPEMPSTQSFNTTSTGHDGVFTITVDEVDQYVRDFNPVILRHDIRTETMGYSGLNIGKAKGRTYDRVMIFPTKPMKQYLQTNDLSKVGGKAKLYVAVTRARHSVAFVID